MPGISIGADWFDREVENIVTNGVPIATILDPALYAQYSSLVTRAPACAGGQPCPITAIDQRFVNVGKVKIQGVDVDARFTSPATAYGRFSAPVAGTYYIKYDLQQPDGIREAQTIPRTVLGGLARPRTGGIASVDRMRFASRSANMG